MHSESLAGQLYLTGLRSTVEIRLSLHLNRALTPKHTVKFDSSYQKQGSPSTIIEILIKIGMVLGVSLVFGENCRKIGVNTSAPESIKLWHHQCMAHKVMTSPISVQSESSICWGAFPTSWIFIKNPLVISSLFAFQLKYFHSPRLFHAAP